MAAAPGAAKGDDAAVAALLLASASAAAGGADEKEAEQGKLLLQQLDQEDEQQRLGGQDASRSVLIFCTNNQHKLQEAQKILGTQDALLLSAGMSLFELQSTSPEAIAEAKCKEARYKLQLQWKLQQHQQHKNVEASQRVSTASPLVVTEDTCLCFEALNGMPGPYVKWFLERAGPDGLSKMLHGFDNRGAYALCTLCVVELDDSVGPDGQPKRADVKIFQGRTKGSITREPRGPRTFGWDCIFQPDGHDKTFAEMDKETKNSISHRYKAMEQLRAYIRKRNEVLKGDQ